MGSRYPIRNFNCWVEILLEDGYYLILVSFQCQNVNLYWPVSKIDGFYCSFLKIDGFVCTHQTHADNVPGLGKYAKSDHLLLNKNLSSAYMCAEFSLVFKLMSSTNPSVTLMGSAEDKSWDRNAIVSMKLHTYISKRNSFLCLQKLSL